MLISTSLQELYTLSIFLFGNSRNIRQGLAKCSQHFSPPRPRGSGIKDSRNIAPASTKAQNLPQGRCCVFCAPTRNRILQILFRLSLFLFVYSRNSWQPFRFPRTKTKNRTRARFFVSVLPRGIEPRSHPPQGCILSIKLWEHCTCLSHFSHRQIAGIVPQSAFCDKEMRR